MKKLWFKRKTYGWGWYPVTWQGWIVVAGYIVIMFIIFNFFPINEKFLNKINFLPLSLWFVLTIMLIWISYKRGESPRWQWGKTK